MSLKLDIGFASLAGRKPVNEDFCAAMLPEPGQEAMGSIVAIADGVSAGGMGQEASQTTVSSLVRDYYATPETWDTTVALDRIIAAQNTWLAGINRHRQPVMGLTTLTALVLRGQCYTVAHVGDSRGYLLRGGKVLQLTQDHVVNHPDLKHQLLRAVGAQDHVVVDYLQGELLVGDMFVLVTDGVHGPVRREVFERRLKDSANLARPQLAQPASQKLVDAALADGSSDNVTALVVRVLDLLDATLQDIQRMAQTLPLPPRLKAGDVIDGLSVIAPLADDGMHVLYQVSDPRSQVLYTLKTLALARADDEQQRAMLGHEAWRASRMQSGRAAAHLARLHEQLPTGQERSAFYLLYDWHAGETLQQQLARGHKFSIQQALGVATVAAEALSRLHGQSLMHCHIKPAKLHQGKDGVLRLLDLGATPNAAQAGARRRPPATTPGSLNTGQWDFGGAADCSPDVRPDAQTDVFALGVTLYELLTGKPPYGDATPGRYHRDPEAPSSINPEVPIWLGQIVLKAVARDKRRRFESAQEMLLALERGASRPQAAPQSAALMQPEPTALWKIVLMASLLSNLLLVYWLLFGSK